MKICIGQSFGHCGSPPRFALWVEGVGMINSDEVKDEHGYQVCQLNKRQLKKFKDVIEKEINHGKQGKMERLNGSDSPRAKKNLQTE